MQANFPFSRNWFSRGVAGPSNASVKPTTLMTAVRVMPPTTSSNDSAQKHLADFGQGPLQRPIIVARLEFVNGLEYGGLIHLVDLKALANFLQQGNRQPPAKMFPEFFKPFENHTITAGIDVEQFVCEQIEPKGLDQPQDALAAGGVKKAHAP